jgi:hypothetical protein
MVEKADIVLDREVLNNFVNENIDVFHNSRLTKLQQTKLTEILKNKNPYLFRAKNITTAGDLVKDLLDAVLYASEEKFMGDFLEKLAIFVVEQMWGGQKSSTTGIDLDFTKNGIRYLVSVKSGPNWGNSTSNAKQRDYFHTAVGVIKQQSPTIHIEPVLGICYSKKHTSNNHGIMTVHGQSFWHLLTDDKDFYKDIVEPIGYKAEEHNESFMQEKARILNLFAAEFMEKYCDDGVINWEKLVQFNSGNMA